MQKKSLHKKFHEMSVINLVISMLKRNQPAAVERKKKID